MIRQAHRRLAAAVAAVCAVAGAVAITVAVVAGPGPGFSGYVSEAGITGTPYAGLYRAGMFGLAAGLLLLAVALPADAPPAGLRTAVALLVAGAATTATSGAVSCSDGCPLPPYEKAGVADLVHGGASIAAVASCVFAMVAVTLATTSLAQRRLSGTAAAVALPLSAAIGLAMLTVGRGALVGILERLLLANVVLWSACLAIIVAVTPHRHSRVGP